MQARLAIVDVETTGSDPAGDRITEIAVLQAEGGALTAQWSTLVNPGTPIPGVIQALTGISPEMVAAAPRFAEIAGELEERLAGRVLVAHNARFDYGFLGREFERAGINYRAKTLCTVRLSRRLYPDASGHDLDSLIERHRLECAPRHRALPDAAALWQFLRIAAEQHGDEVVDVAARQIARQPTLPPQLDPSSIDEIPDASGVYLLYGEGAAPLHIGKSRAMRSRVLQHFISAASWMPRVRRIEWQRTAGELGALLREAQLVKALDPTYNRKLRRPERLCGLARPGPCFRYQIGRCAGVCAGKESIHAHHGRLAAALAPLKSPDWPHRGPLGVVEADARRDATEVHILDRWCYLGTATSEAEVADLLEARRPRFDYDHYRILSRHLGKRGVRVVPLSA